MADILIRGMAIPKKDEILVFDEWHGKAYARSTANTGTRRYEVVPLPEGHGRLIDADAIDTRYSDPEVIETLQEAPTIVPAEGGGEDG